MGHLETYLYPTEGSGLYEARRKLRDDPAACEVVRAVAGKLHHLPEWTAEGLGRTVREAGRSVAARGAALYHPVRLALTGSASGPDLGLVMAALGRREVTRRLEATLADPVRPGADAEDGGEGGTGGGPDLT